ncbi:putative bifunctional Dihydrofolate/Folylpolyglutamate synthase (chromatophore) [Paulinella micropora]|uniref:Bifunctional Dihydrofolate/Folylpolyglutamate synthase n=1 Tax=Paulinella micropora TaxID=1928728 RepID=A0A1L5YB17_9EUKA|nr:putative bifunctional Dihydrofolate/Folylpolyglutamate synthase [Paulinella micropora]AQX44657.1 putative bifunctional Dihydrofolate/Folylpolyglutamate synthase [Paulinella micropora]BBL85863.1 putative bifunctional Dihydrofolate/Folylpolyglutamate synthase [Paulinella micropora]
MDPNSKYFDKLIATFSSREGTLSLNRLQLFLQELNNPESDYIALQVAGTNGKGSICALLHNSLSASGLKSGLMISPHLSDWQERICIRNEIITAHDLEELLLEIGPLSKKFLLTPFELITAAGFIYFSRQKIKVAVLEVGLGGRLDATSIHPHRQIVGFGNIGEDHQEFLGSDLVSIAKEKAGVLSPGAIAISAPQRKEVAQVLEKEAIRVGAQLRWVKPLDWPCGLTGQVQRYNSAVALGMIDAMASFGWRFTKTSIQSAFQNARWPGRCQIINWQGNKILIDGAHNSPAARALRYEVNSYKKDNIQWVIGILERKNAPAMIEALLHPLDEVWIVPVPGHASWSADKLRIACPKYKHQIKVAEDWSAALILACNKVKKEGKQSTSMVVITGSLYLVSTAIEDMPYRTCEYIKEV